MRKIVKIKASSLVRFCTMFEFELPSFSTFEISLWNHWQDDEIEKTSKWDFNVNPRRSKSRRREDKWDILRKTVPLKGLFLLNKLNISLIMKNEAANFHLVRFIWVYHQVTMNFYKCFFRLISLKFLIHFIIVFS